MNLADFPVNREIETFYKIQQKNLCTAHEKTLEYFCLTPQCLQEICQICIIFGKHKSHKFVPKKDLIEINETKVTKLNESVENTLFES